MNEFARAGERELQQAALDRLKLIAEITRYQADAIRFAVEVGIPKQRIHELTGRSRLRQAADFHQFARSAN